MIRREEDLRPPIETLSDISWQRVEKNLFKALDCDATAPTAPIAAPRRSRRIWAIAGTATAIAAAAAVLFLVPWSATSRAPSGRSDGGLALSRVVTQDAPSEVSFGEATITVGAESAVTMQGDAASGVLIVLERGDASFAVAPRGHRPPFTVQAGEVMVRVIGTRFSVERHGDAASVHVTEGHVEVVARDQRVQLTPGDSWSSNDTESSLGGGFPDAQPSQDEPRGDRQPGNGSSHDGLPWEGQSSAGAVAVPSEPSGSGAPQSRQRPSAALSAREQFERASALEATDPRAALKTYRALARGTDSWAMNALFAAGRLAAETHDRSAAKLLEAYIRRFPSGPNVADARTLLDRVDGLDP
jgi:hypothetical protein